MAPLFVMSCGHTSEKRYDQIYSLQAIQKSDQIIKDRMEATPVVWTDGSLLLITSRRLGSAGSTIEIWKDGVIVSSRPSELGLISAVVDSGRLVVFGTTDWSRPGNEIRSLSTSDLTTWSAPMTVLRAGPAQTIFNSSIASDSTGFIMAYEVCEPNTECFSARFAHSTDLMNWQAVGTILLPDRYLGCPTIRFLGGYYYVFYLGDLGHHATLVARSTDLVSWQHSSKAVLSSLDRTDEGANNSDMDFVEESGEIKIIYAFGSQTTGWADLRWATYPGTFAQFVNEFF